MRRRFNGLVIALVAFALVAAACGGDDSEGSTDDAVTSTTTGVAPTTLKPAKIYTDPRGGIYADFQKTFDRGSDPFSSETEFCIKEAPKEALKQTEAGISATTLVLAHIRTKLEELASFGFDVYVGNTSDMFSVFSKVVNEQCGGVNGRMIDLQNIEVTALGSAANPVDAARNQACVTATEDKKAAIVLNSSGFQGTGILCIVEDHKAIYISTTNGSQEFLNRSGGRMFSTSGLVLDDYNTLLVNEVVRTKIAAGKVVGVIDSDTPGQNEATKKNFIEPLEKAGIKVASYSTLGCKGTTSCADGLKEAVSKLIASKVDFLYPNLNVVSLPGFIKEMVAQGVKPGQVQFINSNFNSQAGDLVSGKVSELGGAEAGALYNGAIFFDPAPTGNYRLTDDPTPFSKMCNDTYQKYSTLPANAGTKFESAGKTFKFKDDFEVSPYGMVVSVCSIMRATLRAVYRAGVNPTRDEITKAMQNLGPIDITYMQPASWAPGKSGAPDGVYQLKYNYPCPGGTINKSNSCITQTAGPTALKLR